MLTTVATGYRPAAAASSQAIRLWTQPSRLTAGPGSVASDRWTSTGCCWPQPRGLLRRRGDGDQGAGLDGAGVRAARLLLPRDRPQPARRRPLPRAGRRVRRRHRRRAAGPRRSCSPPTARRPRSSPPPGQRAATSSTRVPARHQGAPRGEGARRQGLPDRLRRATRATRRRSARWRWRPSRSTGSRPIDEVDALPDVRRTGRPARPDHALATATGRACGAWRWSAFPDVWMPGRSDLCFATTNRQSALMAMVATVRRRRRHRLGQLVEHPGAGEAGPRARASPGCAA